SEAAHCPGVLSLAQISAIFQPGSACAWTRPANIAAAANATHGARSLATIRTSLACCRLAFLCTHHATSCAAAHLHYICPDALLATERFFRHLMHHEQSRSLPRPAA